MEKSNLLFQCLKIQKNPILSDLSVDILNIPSSFEHLLLSEVFFANLHATGKTSGSVKPRTPSLQMLWGIVTQTIVDHCRDVMGVFTQGDPGIFLTTWRVTMQSKDPRRNVTPLRIPWDGFPM
ncbi:hypothetical protein Tco_1265297 [Tanacetum coccineum]